MPVGSIFLYKAHWTNLKALDRKPSHLSINKPKISIYTCQRKNGKSATYKVSKLKGKE